MLVALNVILIAFVLLIAYWWANQGLFSAILHLLCVIAAGAIALAFWEPITVGLLLRGTPFDDYAWGVTLIGVFVLALLVLRFALDKIAPGNVQVPHWANMVFGFPVGAAAGVLTIGLLMIGSGYIQSTRQIMGFEGMVRVPGGRIEEKHRLWVPVHQWTYEFYSYLSAGSLYPTFNDTPLRQYNPDLHLMAASLVRDSAVNGRGKLSLRPEDARIEELVFDPNSGKYLVRVRFETGARDFGQQLTLSSSQVRLIGHASSGVEPKVVHPESYKQYSGRHRFDDLSHYVSSEPGQATALVELEFPSRELGNVPPRFIQIRNTRYRLPQPREGVIAGDRTLPAAGTQVALSHTARNITSAIEQSNEIRPIQASTNQKPARIQLTEDRFISGGEGEFPARGTGGVSRNLVIQGIFQPEGTWIVKVDISRESPANIFGAVQEQASRGAELMLVDSLGRPYYPIGYMHHRPDGNVMIKVDFQRFLKTMDQIPPLPTAGGQKLVLLFSVTDGATITGFKLGDVTVGTCNVTVRDPKIN